MLDEAEISFQTGYEQNKKSTIAPFFLAFESDALIKLGKFEDAYKILVDAVGQFSKNSPYYYLYSIKLALMEIDKKDAQKGIEDLNILIKDSNNIFKDMAAFYLGEYYWANNNIDKAKEQFQIALAYNPESTWGNLAKMRLERLG
jgi:predicted negative regulator of RcsB-dependent stress response